jgi:predicted nucleic acid-binding Zn ribbon protein
MGAMIRYTYECDVCSERDALTFNDPSEAPETITCTVCGATNKMLRLPPSVANHFAPTKRRKT